ncbi:anti-sigma-K factor RskA [Sulfitobacter undariae]|uniref:Anti-sigma-K factor RskA n=1 Tax=Sulfitobacter undariae TaxID=1563671 RepID=A0A7W6E551_9RHOB|nr:anti-sigma factor [Sulfitobacter undariae]MBB3992832.1 anti-sigma-K factor RskA [Sulfitobacter undariae]
MTDDVAPQGDDLLAAELALGLLEGDELSQANARALRDPAFAVLLVAWQERLVAMTDEIAPVTPPKHVKKRLLSTLFVTAPVPVLQRLWIWKGLSFAALALAAFLGVQQLGPETPPAAGPLYATQLMGDGVPLQVLAVLDARQGDVALSRVAGREAEGRSFELWAIVPDTPPISLGIMQEGATMRVALPENLRSRGAEITLAITDEPAGGSPNGVPTGDVLAASALVAI